MGATQFSQSLAFFIETKHHITELLSRARQDVNRPGMDSDCIYSQGTKTQSSLYSAQLVTTEARGGLNYSLPGTTSIA